MMAPVKRTRVSSCPPTLAKVRESADAPFRSSGSPSRPIGVSDAGVQSGISGAREVEESRRGRGRTPGIAKDRVAVEDDAREGGGHVARRDAVDALRTERERQRRRPGRGGRGRGSELTMFLGAHSTASDEHMWRTAAFEAL